MLAVFFLFASLGFAGDIVDMGRQPLLRFGLSVTLSGLFAVGYAASGFALRGKSWKVFLPLFVLHFLSMGLLSNRLPDGPQRVQFDAAETVRLQSRFAFDGLAVIVFVFVGYAGFVFVSIREGRRYARSQIEKASLESEMAAAREVQSLMVPANPPPITGYTLECVYRPAAEVGGDFFQVIPLAAGRTLIVIGDVSGKGLRAAMIVSMIVGMLCTVSSFTEEPSEILSELNRRLCGRTHGGFVTCLAVRLEEQGKMVLANAGHLPPYLNATELSFAGSTPLGLVADASYEQTCLEMQAKDVAVLLTDGVAEARNAEGELLGFLRVESLLRGGATAGTIADSAQQHGQNDDLTVIRITRHA
ncbi:MAG: PP2C family protein-serine/threonine phosphatase [Terracidiphilus sp.]